MAHYFGKFVPSVVEGLPPWDWEHFRNAEQPARELKSRAKLRKGKFFITGSKRVPSATVPFAWDDADSSARMLIWLTREQPADDEAPDEVWHLTNRYGLIRTPLSAIIEPVDENSDEVHEPGLDDHAPDEVSVLHFDEMPPSVVWQPPSLDEIAERRVILIGDKRPTSSGAFTERNVERFSPTGLRKPCEECGVVPNAFTLECKCGRS